MKRFLTTAILATLIPGAAFAQTAAPTFTGPHVAIMGGWNQARNKDVLADRRDTNEKKSTVVVRGAAGYDLAIGDLGIIGAEVGVATGGRDLSTRGSGGRFRTDPGITFDAVVRAGVKPVDNVLFFGKAGWAMQRVRTQLSTSTGNLSNKDTEHAFLWGGGAEVAIHSNVALRVDFDHASFNDHYKRNRVLGGINFRF